MLGPEESKPRASRTPGWPLGNSSNARHWFNCRP